MSIETDSQLAADSLLPPTHLSLKHKLFDHFDRFQAPFSERRAILISGDLIIVLVAITGAFGLWQLAAERASGQTSDLANLVQGSWYWLPFLLGGWYLLAYLNDLYDIPSSTYRLVTAVRLSLTGLLFLVLYLAVFFFLPEDLPRRFFLYFLLLAMPGIMAWRWFYAALFSISPLQHRLMIVGHGKRAQAIAYSLAQIRNLNYRLVGYVLDQPCLPYARPWGLAELGTVPQLTSLAKSHRVAEIVVANDDNLSPEVFQQLIECQARGVRVSLMPELYEKLYHKVPIEHIDLYWALQVMQDRPVFNRIQLILKRVLDVGLAMNGLLLVAPLLPLVALAIWIDSPGPIFYRQVRAGRAGQPFKIYKFRTMTPNAEKGGQAVWAQKNDARITRVGKFLRQTRLDELPQLINILKGEMSFVGPRPERPEFVEQLQEQVPFYRTRLMVKPGLTGWAQTHYDYGNSVKDALIKLQYDFYYIRHWSLWLDIYTIFRTFAVVLRFKGM